MTVKELVSLLKTLPQDYLVIMSSDGEGNSFSPLADLGLEMYVADSTYSGDVVCEEDVDDGMYKQNAVVLCPTN